MDAKPTVLTMLPDDFPAGELNGTVVEFAQHEDGTITAEIRIPGPPVK